MLTRRQMMVALGAATLPLPLSAASVPVTLTPGTAFTRIGSRDIAMLGFNGTCPGPEIRLRQNEILRARDPRTLAWDSVAQRDGRRKRADTGCHHPE